MPRKRETSSTGTPDQIGEVVGTITGAVVRVPGERLQYWIGRKKKLAHEVTRILGGITMPDYRDLLADWEKFCREVYGITVDLSGVRIPNPQEGFDRLLVVPQGLTMNRAYKACADAFPSWRYVDDLDKEVIQNDRDPKNGSYPIWARNRVEADDELRNLSANELTRESGTYMTLLERLLYERKYFAETGGHLDVKNVTLCAGSRYLYGYVPDVHWDGELEVGYYHPEDAYDYLRARAVVP